MTFAWPENRAGEPVWSVLRAENGPFWEVDAPEYDFGGFFGVTY
jgi:hypothetical protein